MNSELKAVADTFVESFGNLGESLGISKVVAQLYGLLYLSPEPVSLDDMCESLKISKGNASMNIRYLEQWNAVKKVWQKGSRKDYYEVNPEIEKIALNRLKEGLTRRLTDFMSNIEKIEKTLQLSNINSNNKKLIQKYRKRIKKIKGFNNTVNKLISIGGSFI